MRNEFTIKDVVAYNQGYGIRSAPVSADLTSVNIVAKRAITTAAKNGLSKKFGTLGVPRYILDKPSIFTSTNASIQPKTRFEVHLVERVSVSGTFPNGFATYLTPYLKMKPMMPNAAAIIELLIGSISFERIALWPEKRGRSRAKFPEHSPSW